MMLVGQSVQITPFDKRLARVVSQLQDEVQGLVPSSTIADKLSMPGRTVRYYLRRVERAGLIFRPAGERSGYSAAQGLICSIALRESIERQARCLSEVDVQLMRLLDHEPRIASKLSIDMPTRTIQYRLQKLETMGLIHRPAGERSGYAIANQRALKVLAWAAASQLRGEVDPFQMRILREMRWRERITQSVQTKLLADYMEIPERSMRYYMRQLESLKLLHRPHGAKAGYCLTAVARALLDMTGGDDGKVN